MFRGESEEGRESEGVKESGEGKNSGDNWGDSGEERESVGEKGGEVGGRWIGLTCSKKASMALIAEFLLSLLLCCAHSIRQSYMYCRVM